MSRRWRTALQFAALALVAACGKSGSGPSKEPPRAQKPRGWKAYDGKRHTDVAALPQAVNATVYSTDDAPVELSSLWNERRTLLVFYRGDW